MATINCTLTVTAPFLMLQGISGGAPTADISFDMSPRNPTPDMEPRNAQPEMSFRNTIPDEGARR